MFKTETNYTYIVIETSGQRCFYSKDMDLTDVFADVMRFSNYETAKEYIAAHGLDTKYTLARPVEFFPKTK